MQKKRRRPWFRAPRSGDRDSLLGGIVARWVPIIKEPTFPFEVSARGWVWCQLSFYGGFGRVRGVCQPPAPRRGDADAETALVHILCVDICPNKAEGPRASDNARATLWRECS